jgi:hypothetical protein
MSARFLLLMAMICAFPLSANAAKCSGTNVNNLLSWDSTEIAKGSTLATLRATSVTMNGDPSSPNHLLSGECIGSFHTGPDGKTSAYGHCARRDKDGDVLDEEWVATDGAGAKGDWKHVGGTGKFANYRNAGQWEFSPLQGKMSAVRWTGDCR